MSLPQDLASQQYPAYIQAQPRHGLPDFPNSAANTTNGIRKSQPTMRAKPQRAVPPRHGGLGVAADDLAKLFGTQDNFNMLKGLLQ